MVNYSKPHKQLEAPNPETASKREDLPKIGKAIAADLRLVNIKHPQDLINKDPYQLYDDLCSITGKKHDPCVIDVFLSVVDFMEGGDAKPWWDYTAERKKHTLS